MTTILGSKNAHVENLQKDFFQNYPCDISKFLSWPKEQSYDVFGSFAYMKFPNKAKNTKRGQKIHPIFQFLGCRIFVFEVTEQKNMSNEPFFLVCI